MRKTSIVSMLLCAISAHHIVAVGSSATPGADDLLFNEQTRVIFVGPESKLSEPNIRQTSVAEAKDLVAGGATIDDSAAYIKPLIDASKAPEVAAPGETTGTPSTSGTNAVDAGSNTTSSTGATDFAASATGTASGDAPLPGAAAATPAADANGASILSSGSASGTKASPDSIVNTAGSLTPLADADAGNGGASGAANTSGSASGATALDASSSAGTAAAGTALDGVDKDAQIASLSAEVANLTGENKRLAALVDEKTVQIGELQSAETQPHPAKAHVTGLLRKIRSGEAIVLGELEKGLTYLEETL